MREIFLSIFLCWALITNSQVLKSARFLTIDSLNFDGESSELMKEFREIFKLTDVIVMSEPTHFEGTTLKVEEEIIKGLISTHQIDCVYLESSWVNVEKVKVILRDGGINAITDTYKYCGTGFLKDWVRNGFWNYLARKFVSGDINIIGFDIEPTTTNCVYEMYLRARNIPYLDSLRRTDINELKMLNQSFYQFERFGFLLSINQKIYGKLKSFCIASCKYWRENHNSIEAESWRQISVYFDWIFSRQGAGVKSDFFSFTDHTDVYSRALFNSTRDSLMAANFLREYSQRPNSKAVVLTTAYHSMRNISNELELQAKKLGNPKYIFGEILNDSLRKPYYNILFMGMNGFRGNEKWKRKIKTNPISELNFIKQFNAEFVFANLQGTNLRDTCFKLKFPIATLSEFSINAHWAQIFDGIFFIKTMYPKIYHNYELISYDLQYQND